MMKLLRAGFARMIKNKVFWVCIVFMALIGIFVPVSNYSETQGSAVAFDSYLFGYPLFTGMIAAVFSSLFVGTEYSDKTIRNKIVIGHKRSAVYLSNFVVNTAAALAANAAYIMAVSAVGIPLYGSLVMNAHSALQLLAASVLMTAAFTAIFTLLGMLIQSKALVAIVSILGVVVMLAGTLTINQRLREPEYYEYIEYDVTGEVVGDAAPQMLPNPNYLQPDRRALYQFIYDFIPTGQGAQIFLMTVRQPGYMLLYSLMIIVAATTCGIFFFQRKDLT